MNKCSVPQEQQDALVELLVTQMLEIINKEAIIPHQQGKMTNADTIFLVSKAVAQVTAIILFAQLSQDRRDRLEPMLDSYSAILKDYSQQVLGQQHNFHKQSKQPSAWDIH